MSLEEFWSLGSISVEIAVVVVVVDGVVTVVVEDATVDVVTTGRIAEKFTTVGRTSIGVTIFFSFPT